MKTTNTLILTIAEPFAFIKEEARALMDFGPEAILHESRIRNVDIGLRRILPELSPFWARWSHNLEKWDLSKDWVKENCTLQAGSDLLMHRLLEESLWVAAVTKDARFQKLLHNLWDSGTAPGVITPAVLQAYRYRQPRWKRENFVYTTFGDPSSSTRTVQVRKNLTP